ncbi:MAG: SufD family Fe-S cluster assembly protein [Clostridia bacterium]|nr:SufD family Fe-S cluster assembly protein [Clostridia bacterium]
MKKMVVLNETPRRTSKSFGINNIKIENFELPELKDFSNVNIETEVNIENTVHEFKPKFSIGEVLVNQIKDQANKKLYINIDKDIKKPIVIDFELDETQNTLVDNIVIRAEEGKKGTIILKYRTKNDDVQAFHNGVCNVKAKANADIKVIILNLLNQKSENYYSMNNKLEENANLEYVIADFGGSKTVTNYYSSLIGNTSNNTVNTMYLGKEQQLLDLNYIAEVYGKKANIDIEVYGALKDNAIKHFKGTIDFKTGCKKAVGNENEYCMLLSKKAKSKALPMLLCSEDDVQGNHSNSAGKIDEDKLYYIMTRGISKKEAQKLIVKAKFNNILNKIEDETLKNELIEIIDRKLDY